MALQSDLKIDFSKLDIQNVSAKTNALNENLIKIMKNIPMWWEIGAPKYREMRAHGDTSFPAPKLLDSAEDIDIPSRGKGRNIPCRVLRPTQGKSRCVFYHIHGGGWVLGSHKAHDVILQYFADQCQMTVISVGYRLAPEHPYPAPNEDCYDVADWLVDNASQKFGAPLWFLGGDSAGGQLSAVTLYHMLESRPDFALRGVIFNFAIFTCSEFLPAAYHLKEPLVLDLAIMEHFVDAYCPGMSTAERRSKWISPMYAELSKLKLPPALFNCGTADCLLDDSVVMATKWQMAGAEGVLKLYPGGAHGFIGFTAGLTEQTELALANIAAYMNAKST